MEKYYYGGLLMKYYAERKSLLENDLEISFEQLKEVFFSVYKYFANRNCFDAAINGIWIKPQWQDEYQAIPPLFEPSPEIFFMNHLHSTSIYPIYQYYQAYSEIELFTVIEILYDKIAVYNYKKDILETEEIKKEFSIQINNILQFYDGGYFLETNSGTITKGTDDSLKMMLTEDLQSVLNEDTMTKIRTSIKLYYRFDSNLETKKKAINILADILEPLRIDLKNILNEKYEIKKNEHDKIIFDIVNSFNIRHNDKKQLTHYEHEIWYDWMMQYYCSVIITYHKLKAIKSYI
ncbi:hypothetical protein RSJ17_00595 (plasmid) [Clostridium argentinense]|nr:hypothetical protein RSJ17_00595 [Clostridium argentinense]